MNKERLIKLINHLEDSTRPLRKPLQATEVIFGGALVLVGEVTQGSVLIGLGIGTTVLDRRIASQNKLHKFSKK